MTEPSQENGTAAAEATTASGIGAVFAATREKSGMSIEDAAAKLRLSPRQVQALEADDQEALPDAMFVRGFIRNYARLLQLDPQPLLEAYGAVAQPHAQRGISLPSVNITIAGHNRKAWMPYAVASLVIGLVLGGWMLYTDNQADHPAPQAQPAAKPPVAPPAPAVTPPPQAEAALPFAPATEAATPSTPLAAPGAAPVAEAGAVPRARLKLTFSAQSWVTVADRDGKEIYNKTAQSGGEELVEGLPPLKLVIGNASGVHLIYNDKPVDLASYTKSNVARLTLE